MPNPKKGKEKAQNSVPKCICDHPFNCSCGNRPPRPSKGHKWDSETQSWGGKGHKQKGASGQVASVAEKATATDVGKTQLAQWQRLPSQLIQEYCNKQKRPNPIFKNIETKKGVFKYRCIVPDAKDREKDLTFVPKASVSNEEQAKEEACLLALLQLTPALPHERKLPEPYKTTWINAIENHKKAAKQTNTAEPQTNKIEKDSSSKPQPHNDGAKASDNLTMARSYTSTAEKRKLDLEKRRERNERIRHHEAIRMANQNHPVFMSAKIRSQIEKLLRGEHIKLYDDGDENIEDAESDVQEYIEERLHSEGFTRHQARTSFQDVLTTKYNMNTLDESKWDQLYEDCLQWLLVHLDEDLLPEGFDPRGGTLDVIAAPGTLKDSTRFSDFAERFGLNYKEASLIHQTAMSKNISPEEMLWITLCRAANVELKSDSSYVVDTETNKELFTEEIEALQAIFASQCSVGAVDDILTEVKIVAQDGAWVLHVVVQIGRYPQEYPERVLVYGRSTSFALQVEVTKFMATLVRSEPMIFQIYGFIADLIPSFHASRSSKVLHSVGVLDFIKSEKRSEKLSSTTSKKQKFRTCRPRERSHFWSSSPADTPPATAFPVISTSLKRSRQTLPAASVREAFLESLSSAQTTGRVLLVTGEPGCGKTTQIPQFILEEYPKDAKIVVCQPRRLAAVGVANRVAEERGESQPGLKSVGYVVRGDTAINSMSRLVFCTTGVFLRQLQNERPLDCLTHIIIDEVHERHLDTDILLGLLKKSLGDNPHVTVILMSATLDAERFASYWGDRTPRVHIHGRTFPVRDLMLEDVLRLTAYVPPKRKGKVTSDDPTIASDADSSDDVTGDDDECEIAVDETVNGISINELIKRIDETIIDYTLLAKLVKHLVEQKEVGDDGSILVFLPGAPEISKAIETIKRLTKDLSIQLFLLHGGLQPKEQNAVFHPAARGMTKVIVSTNVAETSVTIPDVTIVVDSAREKQSSYDPVNRMPLLIEKYASKASLKQRRGRAGRVREGTCYKLISRATYSKIQEHSEPEILRCAIDQALLSLLFLGVEKSVHGEFMSTLIDPPSSHSIRSAAFNLAKLGAILSKSNGDMALTPLGAHLAAIPAPPIVGKLLVVGSILGCRQAALGIAAGISLGRSPFLRISPPKKTNINDEPNSVEEMKNLRVRDERKALFKKVGNSDHAVLAEIFSGWEACSEKGTSKKRYCESLGLSFTGMRDMSMLARQLDSSLTNAGFRSSDVSDRNASSWRIIRTCAVAAMSPGQLVKVVRPAVTYQETAEGAKEKEGDARGFKFFVRTGPDVLAQVPKYNEERVFIHPSSANFFSTSYSCPWLVYNSLIRTTKPFLRDLTECTAYALLLFGGELEVYASKGLVIVDQWVQLSSNAKIATLVGGLRKRLDELLDKKIEDPTLDITGSEEMQLIVKLIKTDGLGI